MKAEQAANQVLMIRPVAFAGNIQTAISNHFQQLEDASSAMDAQMCALYEFDLLVANLRAAGVVVHVIEDTLIPNTPDSVFPNNWVSFHGEGTVVLYPMLAVNRRQERRIDILEHLSLEGLRINELIDLSHYEQLERFLEGTGSMVLDRINRIAYACVSPRTDLNVLGEFAQRLDYDVVSFHAMDANGMPIYHTNVLMCVGTHFAVVCSDVIAEQERFAVLERLRGNGHEIIEISTEQMYAFAGNMLELKTTAGDFRVAMSRRAFDALSATQRATLAMLSGPLIVTPIPTIERLGGGSVRCMLAEIFLPTKPIAG